MSSTLLVDAGNTRLKWALCSAGGFSRQGELAYDETHLSPRLAAQWDVLSRHPVSAVVLSNVAGQRVHEAVLQWVNGLQETTPMTIETVEAQKQAFGVNCAYARPERLGADRWAGLVAARHHLPGASCIIDCGTALTIDVLGANGDHLGGIIVPGRELMRRSLQRETAQVDVDTPVNHTLFAAKDTADAVQAGIMAAIQGTVENVLRQYEQKGLSPLTCVLTGGDAPAVLPVLPRGSLYEPHWVLKGLAVIAGCQ